MLERKVGDKRININEEGYFVNPQQWDREVAIVLAREKNITLTDQHWKVLEYLRQAHQDGVGLSLRKVSKSGVVDTKSFYSLFPGGPLKISTYVAGIPKPASCV